MIVIGCGINRVSYCCTNQSIMRRVLGAVNLKEAQKGALLSGPALVFCPISLCLTSIAIAPFPVCLPAGISTFPNQMWGHYGVLVLVIAMMGMLNRDIPNFAPKLAIAVHIISHGLMMNLLPFHFLYFETASFLLDIILLWACVKLRPRETPYELKYPEVVDMTPWRYRWPVIIVTFAILIEYTRSSPPWVWAAERPRNTPPSVRQKIVFPTALPRSRRSSGNRFPRAAGAFSGRAGV